MKFIDLFKVCLLKLKKNLQHNFLEKLEVIVFTFGKKY